MRGAAALFVLLISGCAFGSAQLREDSYRNTVLWARAGDGECSDPAPYTSIRACLIHDAAYALGRMYRCIDDPEGYGTEQSRLVADYGLAQQMALDGYPEGIIELYFRAVRIGAWPSWYLRTCE